MDSLFVGVHAKETADVSMLREGGITHVRRIFPFPFASRLCGEVTQEYRRVREQTVKLVDSGILLFGVTPLTGWSSVIPKGKPGYIFQSTIPDWCGVPGSADYLRAYEETCRWIAEDLRGLVSIWQIANELDNPFFAGSLDLNQGCELILAGARGLKTSDSSLKVGTNTTGIPASYYLLGRLFAGSTNGLDYCGIDGYYGTWNSGGPENWNERIKEVGLLTRVPILINEWGFSSAGAIMSEEERRSGAFPCQLAKWPHGWKGEHTLEKQAQYFTSALDIFKNHRTQLIGLVLYRWEDQQQCNYCGSKCCPVETAWGIVDAHQKPKPSFYAFREGVRQLSQSSEIGMASIHQGFSREKS